eukprot:7128415-Pyramimonas_sp.AAC.1
MSDNENVVRGWYAQQYLNPGRSEVSGLWAEIGVLVKHRDPSDIVVLHVSSHQTAKDVCEKQTPEWLLR